MLRLKQHELDIWLTQERRKPLIVSGARQVGKSTLIRNWVESHQLALIEVNLERFPTLDKVFATFDIDKILENIYQLPKMKRPKNPDSFLLFLDEIQATPQALAALRYFYEDRPEIKVIAAGSLLEFTLLDHSFSMPVGRVQFMHLRPMSFCEFLIALNENELVKVLNNFKIDSGIVETAHARLTALFGIYAFVGGMPEAVKAYVKTKNLEEVRNVHSELCESYKSDFSKYSNRHDVLSLRQVFDTSVKQLGRKIKFNQLLPDEQSKTTRRIIDLLSMAQIIDQIPFSHCNGIPLSSEEDSKVYKIVFIDVGLMNFLLQTPYLELTGQKNLLAAHRGAVAEQVVGQGLLVSQLFGTLPPKLFYWMRDKKSQNAEIDFCFAFKGQVFPVEVKSGKSGSLRSLHQFATEKKIKTAIRFDGNQPSLQNVQVKTASSREVQVSCDYCDYKIVSLPLYAAEQVQRFI